MTPTSTSTATTSPGQARSHARSPSRRSLRLVIPFAVVGLVWMLATVAHAYQEPNLGGPGTLAPNGTGRHGASQLADRLRAAGVRIDHVTSSAAAINSARVSDSTIFVPAPDYLSPTFLL